MRRGINYTVAENISLSSIQKCLWWCKAQRGRKNNPKDLCYIPYILQMEAQCEWARKTCKCMQKDYNLINIHSSTYPFPNMILKKCCHAWLRCLSKWSFFSYLNNNNRRNRVKRHIDSMKKHEKPEWKKIQTLICRFG